MRRANASGSDIMKACRKLAGMFGGKNKSNIGNDLPGLSVHQPMMIPLNDIPIFREFNRRSVSRRMRRIVRSNRNTLPIVVSTVPNACDYIDSVPSSRIVYYCVDDFSEWPGLDKSLVLEMEAMLIAKADVFIASSARLYERLTATGKPTHLLTHGVDIEHFSSDSESEHERLAGIPEPRVGYFGLFDDRSDQELIATLASQMPDVSFVIAGSVETAIDKLEKFSNIYFLGTLEYLELPSLVKGLRVLFLPYHVDRLSESLSPLKLKEYLVTGRPVISTPIAAAVEIGDCVQTANSSQEWRSAIREFLNDDWQERKEKLVRRMANESWSNKASNFLDACES